MIESNLLMTFQENIEQSNGHATDGRSEKRPRSKIIKKSIELVEYVSFVSYCSKFLAPKYFQTTSYIYLYHHGYIHLQRKFFGIHIAYQNYISIQIYLY